MNISKHTRSRLIVGLLSLIVVSSALLPSAFIQRGGSHSQPATIDPASYVPGEVRVILGGASGTLRQDTYTMPVEKLADCHGGIVGGVLIGVGDF